MTILENIFGIFVSTILLTGFLVIMVGLNYALSAERWYNRKSNQSLIMPVKARPEDGYLVVCRTKKYAKDLRRRLLDCISGYYTPKEMKVFNNYGKYMCIYFQETHLVVRFISEREYFEASRGFRGWVVEENQVEEWLDAAEGLEKEKDDGTIRTT